MAEAMKFELVSPERKLASIDVNMVLIPAADGDIAAMHNHAPTIVTLRPGILRAVATNGDITEYVVSGGFADIAGTTTSVLAERSLPKDEADAAFLDAELAAASHKVEIAADEASKALAELALNDINSLREQLGK